MLNPLYRQRGAKAAHTIADYVQIPSLPDETDEAYALRVRASVDAYTYLLTGELSYALYYGLARMKAPERARFCPFNAWVEWFDKVADTLDGIDDKPGFDVLQGEVEAAEKAFEDAVSLEKKG